jgi:hypothetical protein
LKKAIPYLSQNNNICILDSYKFQNNGRTGSMHKKHVKFAIILLPIQSLILTQSAFAYLDAGTGSMILQLVLGGFAGLLVILKLYWRNFKAFLRRKNSEELDS